MRNRWCRSAQPPANILNPYRDSRTGHVVKRVHPCVQHIEKHAWYFCFLGVVMITNYVYESRGVALVIVPVIRNRERDSVLLSSKTPRYKVTGSLRAQGGSAHRSFYSEKRGVIRG